ncbi:MAG: GDP-mannose 4,6-dehydratase [Candidatus Marinimicrobia bacterium]|nr:GDP-mannose 4,6-dehydratase [Candidatus Neomarinimicrobiota bacterium]|tara:strand:- start:22575 stop:23597 length:1023 start_codon:yes stop_codon:yes gene_type:complete
MNKIALITGISGQDGAYLAKFLLSKNYKVIGGERRSASGSLWRLNELGIEKDIEIVDFELSEFTNIYRVIEKYKPDEIYNLAAQSFVAASFEMPIMTSDVTGLGVSRILEAVKNINPSIKFYQASSSEMFGKVSESPQNEKTIFYPRSPYGVAKLFGHWITINYREAYNIFACSGISFNHESPLRGNQFVTKKITHGLSKVKLGILDYIELGNLDSKRDWGYARDYVEAMYLMLQQKKPDDFIIATGKNYSVRDFIEETCAQLKIQLEWTGEKENELGIDVHSGKEIIKINPKFYRPSEVDLLLGDAKKAKNILNWQPKTNFKKLVQIMVESDYSKLKSI